MERGGGAGSPAVVAAVTLPTRRLLAWALAALSLLAPPAGAVTRGRVLRAEAPAPSLGEAARDVWVYLPRSYDDPASRDRRYPVVFLLHGFPGTAGDWFGRGHAGETADLLIARGEMPEVILVGPDGNRGFFGRTLFANAWDGSFAMDDFIRRDLVAWVDSTFRTRASAAGRGAIGLSDGGTAAVNLVLRHPETFGAAGAHSANYRVRLGFGVGRIVGPADQAGPRLAALSPLEYLPTAERGGPDPALYFDCGVEDESIGQNREFHRLLDSLGVAHAFREYPGSHTWSYWRSHLVESLREVTRHLADAGLPPEAKAAGGPPNGFPRSNLSRR